MTSQPSLLRKTLSALHRWLAPGPLLDEPPIDAIKLEDRVLYSASPLLDPALLDPAAGPQHVDLDTALESLSSLLAAADEPVVATNDDEATVHATPVEADTPTRHELVFIDTSAGDYQSLIDDITDRQSAGDRIDVVLLDSTRDGIEQLSEVLANYDRLDAVHIVSHGADGAVRLGNAWLTATNLEAYTERIVGWQDALNADADLLFYGCDLAANQDGELLVESLSLLTGADVAASDDVTGHATLGGDWDLEYQVGLIDTAVAFSTNAQASWYGTLDITSNLILHETLDADATDSSGNSYDGTLTNGANIDTGDSAVGVGSLSVSEASDQYVDLDTHLAGFSGVTEGTIAAWIKTTDTDEGTIFDVANSSGDSFSTLHLDPSGRLTWEIEVGATDIVKVSSTASINDGAWHHVAVTVGTGGTSLFIDGTELTGAARTFTAGSSSSTEFFDDVSSPVSVQVGAAWFLGAPDWEFDGNLDEVRVYDRALSGSDVTELYNYVGPAPDYSSYLGGSGNESISEIVTHSSGDVFIVGRTQSADLPTTVGVVDTTFSGSSDLFVARISPDGNGASDLVYLTYIGGSGHEFGASIEVDAAGNAYIAGATQSTDFTTTGGAYDMTLGGTQDSFLMKLNPTGTSILFSTFIGGSGSESGPDLVLDASDNAYLVGQTTSSDFDTSGGYDTTLGGTSDMYVAKISSDGSSLMYGSYLGGSNTESGGNIAVDAAGLIYVGNYTRSSDYYTTAGAYDTTLSGTQDAILTVLDPTLGASGLVYSTYFGGTGDEGFSHIEVDASGNAYMLGSTDSSDLATTAGAYDTTYAGADDLMVVKFDPSGNGASDLLYSTYLGGTADEDAGKLVLDASGDVFISGTSGGTFPTVNPVQSANAGGDDAVLARLSLDGAGSADLQFATYLGGSGADSGYDVSLDGSGNAYVLGKTASTDYPTSTGAYDTTANGGDDVFFARYDGVAASNQAPVVGLPGGVVNYTENDPATIIDAAATVTDADSGDFNGGTLTVDFTAGGTTNDTLSIVPGGNVTVVGSDVRLTGVTIGTFSGGTAGTPLVITWNTNSTDTKIEEVARQIAYSNTSEDPSTTPRTVRFVLTDGDGGTSTAVTETINVAKLNDAPTLDNSGSPILTSVDQDDSDPGGDTVAALVIDGSITDAEGAVEAIAVTAVDNANGTWEYSLNGGSSWNAFGSPTTGAARLLGPTDMVRFVPNTGFSGSVTAGITYRAWDQTSGSAGGVADTTTNGGTSPFSVNLETADVTVVPRGDEFWLSIEGDENNTGWTGVSSATEGEALAFGDPNLALDPGTTDGTFSRVFNLDDFAADSNADLNGLHYVTRSITIGGGGNTIALQAGDVLFTAKDNETFTSTNSLAATNDEVVLFRPDTPGDYGAGTFTLVLDDFGSIHGASETLSISLVEQDTTVGDAVLSEGTFIFSSNGGSEEDIRLFTPTGVGVGTTTGSVALLIEGDDINISPKVFGLELIEQTTSIGGETLNAGVILVTLDSDDSTVGSNSIAVEEQDVFYLDVTQTTLIAGSSVANATLLLDGSDIALDSGSESLDALTLASSNLPPTVGLPSGAVNYVENDLATVIDATATVTDTDSSDFDGGTLTIDFTAGSTTNDRLSIVNGGNVTTVGSDVRVSGVTVGTFSGGASGTPLVISWNANSTPTAAEEVMRQIGYSNTSEDPSAAARTVRFTLTDGDGGTSNIETETINLTPVNDAPMLSTTALNPTFTENGSAMSLFSGTTADTVESADVLNMLRLTVSGLQNGANELLVVDGTNVTLTNGNSVTTSSNSYDANVSVSGNTANVVITRVGDFTEPMAQGLVNGLQYDNTSDNPLGASRAVTLTYLRDDGGTASGGDDDVVLSLVSNVTINATNDAPTNSVPLVAERTITSSADGASTVVTGDFDGDGDVDVASASGLDHSIVWYANDGGATPSFTANTITTSALGARSLHVADVDGDSDLDLVAASTTDDTVAWYENDGAGNFTQRVVTSTADGAASVFAGDLDGDGDIDIVAASYLDDTIAWFENDGSENFTQNNIDVAANGAWFLQVADVDGDSDLDVVAANWFDNAAVWYENDGAGNPAFAKRVLPGTVGGASSVFAADLDGDGDVDVLATSYGSDTVYWFENDGSENFTQQTISTAVDGARQAIASDVDGDGDLDVLATDTNNDRLVWFENDGGANPTFTEFTFSTTANSPMSLAVDDLDNDGDTDVLAASYVGDSVTWYENEGGDFASIRTNEDTQLVFNGGNLVSISDVDANSGSIDVTLTVTNGTLTLSGTTGLSFSTGDGTDDATMQFSGALTDVNNALNGLAYDPTGDFNGTATLTVTTDDQGNTGGGSLVDTDRVRISVLPVNDAPTATIVPLGYGLSEDSGYLTLPGVSVSDPDAGGANMSVTVAVSNGDLQLGTITGLTFTAGANDSPTMTVEGTETDLNNALATLRYRPTADFFGADMLTLTIDDLGNTGGGSLVDVDTANITVSPVNDAATTTNLAGDTLAYSSGSGQVVIEQGADATVSDIDSPDFDTGNLTASIAAGGDASEDVLSIRNQGAGAGQIGFDGFNVTYGGTLIGTATGGSSGADLVITFNTNATATAVAALAQNVTYENTDTVAPTTGARTVRFTVDDGDGDVSANYDTTVNVSTSIAPVITGLAGDTLNYSEGDGAVVVEQGSNAGVIDADSTDFDNGRLTVSNAGFGSAAEDVLSIRNEGSGAGQIGFDGVNVSYGGTLIGTATGGSGGVDLVVTFNANANATNVGALLNNVTYENTNTDDPSGGTRTIRYVLEDGDAGVSANYDATVNVTPVNDASVVSAIEGTPLGYSENDGAVAITSAISLSDVDDANIEAATIQISANYTNGEDVLGFINTLNIAGSWDAATGTLTLTGTDTIANYVTALRSVTYENTSEAPSTATRTVSFVVNDGDINSNTVTRDIGVTSTNDAPVASVPGAQVTTEDTQLVFSTANGNLISVADVDAGASSIQVTLSAANGTLTLNGTTGLTFVSGDGTDDSLMQFTGSVADANAAIDGLMFDPTADVNGGAGIGVVLSDLGNTGSGGPLGDTESIIVTITPVNDAPVLTPASPSFTTITEDDVANAGDLVSTLLGGSVSDVDSGAVEGVAVTGLASGNGTWEYNTGSGWTAVGTVSSSSSLLLRSTDSLRFVPNGQDGTTASVTYRAWDQTSGVAGSKVDTTTNGGAMAFSSATDTAGITVTSINDASTLSGIEGTPLVYTENAGAVAITGSLSLADVDDTNLESATIQITGNYANGEDLLAFVDTANITGSWDAATGTLTLTGTDTVASYEAALQSVTYSNASDDPNAATRTVSFTVNDGDVDSNTTTRDVAISPINDASLLGSIEATSLGYTENAGPVAITNTIEIVDVDDSNIESAVVQISGNYTNGEDLLAFTNTPSITGTWDAATGTLTLSGTDTVANYIAALQSITYENTSEDPSAATRTVSFTVNDGDDNSNTLTRDVAVTPVNDASVVSGIEATTLSYTENDGPMAITSAISLADLDDTSLQSATVQVTGNYTIGEDRLTFAGSPSITASWDAATGTLTLTGIDSLANYEAALRSVTYENTSDNPTAATRTISFTVDDGSDPSNTVSRDIAVAPVNDASTLSGIEGVPLAYTENDGPLAITNSLAVADLDDTNIESATIRISGGYTSSEDVLAFTNTPNITASWDAATGTLTLTGFDTLANYEAALRSVTYENTSENPVATARIVSFAVNDGAATSNVATRNIDVLPTNDAPVATGEKYSVDNDESLDITAPGLLANDTDVDLDGLTAVLVNGPSDGTLVLNADGSFTYTPDIVFSGIDSFSYLVNDGVANSNVVTVTIDVIAAAGAPGGGDPSDTDPPTDDEPPEDPKDEEEPKDESEPDPEPEEPAPSEPPTNTPAPSDTPTSPVPPEQPVASAPTAESTSFVASAGSDETEERDTPRERPAEREATDERDTSAAAEAAYAARALTMMTQTDALLWTELNDMHDQVLAEDELLPYVAGSATVATAAFSAGYVLWAARATFLVSSLVSTLPAWTTIDPLPVLGGRDDVDDDDESLVDMVETQKAKTARAEPIAPTVPADQPA